jgi:6-phosphogluconolactonase/glucosamine-6-phosphate isomerase/deaminase
MTLPTMLAAERIILLVEGADKAEAVRRGFVDEIGEAAPASLLRSGEAPLEVYLDPAAAADLG